MGAHYFGGKLNKTKRFLLGELLGEITRHLLLMTATPHSGKEEDFQLFLTLLDRDRFEGKQKKTRGRQRDHAPHGQGGPPHLRGQEALPRAHRRDRSLRAHRARVRPLRGRHPVRPRGDEPCRPHRWQAQEHRRLRPHRPAATARLQSGGDLPEPRTPHRAARAQEAGDPQRHLPRERARPRPRGLRQRRLQRRRDRGDRGGAARRGHGGADRRGAQRRAHRTRGAGQDSALGPRRRHRPQVDRAVARSCRTTLWSPTPTAGRASSSSSPSTATPSTTCRPRSGHCSASPTRSRPSTAAYGAASGGRSPRSSPRTATSRSCWPPTPPARASTCRPRT